MSVEGMEMSLVDPDETTNTPTERCQFVYDESIFKISAKDVALLSLPYCVDGITSSIGLIGEIKQLYLFDL